MVRRGLVVAAALAAGCGSADPQPRAAQGPPPDVARLACTEAGGRLATSRVRPQRDGVHVLVANETGSEVAFEYDVGENGEDGGGGERVPPGETVVVAPFVAGVLVLSCGLDRHRLEVVDDEGVARSAELTCERRRAVNLDYAADAPGDPRRPSAVARDYLGRNGLQPGDRVEEAVPTAGEFPTFRVVRDGEVVARVELVHASEGEGWLVGMFEACAGFAR